MFVLDRLVGDFRIGQFLVVSSMGEYDGLEIIGISADAYECLLVFAYDPVFKPNGWDLSHTRLPVFVAKTLDHMMVGNMRFEISIVVEDVSDHLYFMQAIRNALNLPEPC